MRQTIHSFRLRWIVPLIAVIGLTIALSPAASGAGSPDDEAMTADTLELNATFIKLWNEDRIEELVEVCYADDAIVIPPNHEPVRGHDAITAYYKSIRQSFGKLQEGLQPHRVTSRNGLTSFVGQYAFVQPPVRLTSHEAYQRQSDGTVKLRHDMFGFRDPLQ